MILVGDPLQWVAFFRKYAGGTLWDTSSLRNPAFRRTLWINISICSAKKKVENWAFSSSWDFPFIYPVGWSTMPTIWRIQRWVTWKFRTILQQRRVQFNELSHLWDLRLHRLLFTQMPTLIRSAFAYSWKRIAAKVRIISEICKEN